MSALRIEVLGVEPERFAVSPYLLFRLRVHEDSDATVHALVLRAQVVIHPERRGYTPEEEQGLAELFGPRERWAQTARPFLWAHASTVVQGFTGSRDLELPVACSYDLEVAGAKYLQTLGDGEIPLELLFTGTLFTRGPSGFAVEQLAWNLDAPCRMPVKVWRELMDQWFPDSGWLRLERLTLQALQRFRAARGLTSWDETVQALVASAEVPL